MFTYNSLQCLKISKWATLFLRKGVTLNYDPKELDRDLIKMDDKTSILSLQGSTLKSSSAGMRLTRGTLCIDQKNEFYNDDATTLEQGFAFGNGNEEDDLTVTRFPGGSIDLKSGFLDYANVKKY